jgi:hypothetical protein
MAEKSGIPIPHPFDEKIAPTLCPPSKLYFYTFRNKTAVFSTRKKNQ